eukprot:TRINITY_DN59018_c0_g1_i1.p2 TRINITY_DN59018_c0_g1~~TRINITY_DN59018_c0_g1_i1.p2  ORF type:complete len:241 (-),score=80.45 TRINITY_DN59018_c0_g1_i1:511-1233(-)
MRPQPVFIGSWCQAGGGGAAKLAEWSDPAVELVRVVRVPQWQPRLCVPRAPTRVLQSPGIANKGDDVPEPEPDADSDVEATMETEATTEEPCSSSSSSEEEVEYYVELSDDGCGILRWAFKEDTDTTDLPSTDDTMETTTEPPAAEWVAGERSTQAAGSRRGGMCCDCCWSAEVIEEAESPPEKEATPPAEGAKQEEMGVKQLIARPPSLDKTSASLQEAILCCQTESFQIVEHIEDEPE